MRILGIDLGTSSIKAVEMDSAFGRYEIHDYHEVTLTTGMSVEEGVQKLISSLPKPPDKTIVAIPSHKATFRNLQLPTKDKKAIQAGVRFELEDELPFSVENFLFDYSVLFQSKQLSLVHVAITLKNHLSAWIEQWHKAQVDPDLITTEAWSYRVLLNRALGASGSVHPVLLVQIGHEKTSLYLHYRGQPSLIRETTWGGQDLTASICQKMSIPIDQAENLKVSQGFVANEESTSSTPEQKELSLCIEAALEPLASEITQVLLAAKSLHHETVNSIFLTGGSSLLPGLSKWFETRLNAPVRTLPALSGITTSGVTYSEQTEAKFALAAALALSAVAPDKISTINFRKGDFAKINKSRQLDLHALRKPLISLATVLGILFVSLIVQASVYRSRLATADKLLEKNVRSFFGQIANSAMKGYLSNPKSLKTAVNRELNKQRELGKLFGVNPNSPLNFLSSLSASIPKDIVLDLVSFHSGTPTAEPFSHTDTSTSLSFMVANPQIAEKLGNILNNRISNMQRGKMEEVASADPTGKKWKITFSGKPN